ncbi:MAG: immunoglobulin domain-containing protein [Verrucomicrobia bacterium]|nr:immunoglobulin domain-containing protein [Verrucomicrobiota bacterium]
MKTFVESTCVGECGHCPPRRGALAVCFVLAGLCLAIPSQAQSLQDYFTNRVTFSSATGDLTGNNSTATVEVGEPKHGGKVGGHSMWISWVAPTNGVVKFETEGSDFDTLLSAYYFNSTNDTTFDKLIEVARADDSEGFDRESEIEFGVLAGHPYEIAVDGYFGATGLLELKWSFEAVDLPPPVVLSMPTDRSANLGDTVSLTVVLTNAANGQYKWYFNGNDLGITTTNLLIPSLQIANVGRYKMRVSIDGPNYFTIPVELQINTDGATDTLARGKLLDSPSSPLIGENGGGASRPAGTISPAGASGAGVVRGYNGSQIFDTTYGTVDTNEPPHCGISGGVSYWLLYQPPTNGTITLDTLGSSYDTVMEAYTYNGALNSYQDLISIACDHNSAGGTNGASRVQFAVVKSRQYIVAVEGVNNARGTAWLNYSLNTNQQPTAPALLSQPTTVTVAQGSPATLAASLAGSPPLCFTWKKYTNAMPGVTAPGIFFPSTTTNDTADYVMTVTNDLGSLSATLPLHVVIPTQCSLTSVSNWLELSFPTMSGQRYYVEEAATITGPWQPWSNFYFGNDQSLVLYLSGDGTRFFRVRIE